MRLVDSHSHFDVRDFDADRDAALARARHEHPALAQLIFRPGTILGPGAKNQITDIFTKPVIVGLRESETPFVFVSDDDVARAIAQGVRDGWAGVYNLAGEGVLTLREIAARMGKRFVGVPVRALRAAGRDASAAKPVASGYERIDGLYRNADLDTLAAASGHCPGELCVYGFTPAIAPHRAAELSGVEMRLAPIVEAVERLAVRHADLLVEGVGGFAVPLSPTLMLADLIRALGLPV